MQTFLIVLAALVIGLPLAAFIALQVVKWYFARKITGWVEDLGKQIGDLAEGFGAADMPGLTIKLKPAEATPAHHPAEVAAAVDLLTARGFEEVGRFLPNGSAAFIMGLYAHPGEGLKAVVYDTKENPPKLDVSASYEGAQRFAFYSNVLHDGLDKPAYTRYERHPELSNEELLGKAMASLPKDGRDPADPAGLVQHIEDVYEREQLWRVNRGGYTEQEIIRTIESSGEAVTQETIELSKNALTGAMLYSVLERVREQFLETSDMPAGKWDELEDRFFAIHPMADVDTLVENLATLYPEDEEERVYLKLEREAKRRLEDASPFEVFEAMAAETPKSDQLERLGEADGPIRAVYYAGPPYEDDEY